MQAIVYTRYGAPDVLQVKTVEKPVPADSEILIKVRAVEVTKGDCELRKFKFPVKWFWLPMRLFFGIRRPNRQILGGYFSGEIEARGKSVSRFQPGEQVFGSAKLRLGAYGNYMCLPDSYTIVTKPRNMTHVEAAAVPLGGLNALHFMHLARIQSAEKVLINGAGGSIGIFAVQIAKDLGAEVTVVDTAAKESMLRSIGADYFIDYTREDFADTDCRYDVVFNMVAGCRYGKCIKVLKPGGRYLTGNPRLWDMLRSVFTNRFSRRHAYVAFAAEQEEELLTLKNMIEEGRVKSVIDHVYSMEQAAEAHQRVESEQRIGMVVIEMGQS